MKKFIVPVILSFLGFNSRAQVPGLKHLDVNLENYSYPYPVHFLTLLD